MPGFTHLHVHSEYSLLDGLARVPDLVKTAKKRGFDALALTDHGVMYGAVQFYKAAKKEGVKPIIGCELYVAPRSRFDRDAQIDRKSYHLTVLAENEVGYRNLLKLVSQAQLEGFYYKPRVDRELLEKYSEGLIVFSGCAGADAPSKIIREQLDAAREAMGWYSEVFSGRFYVEMMMHDIDFMPRLNRELLGFAKDMNLPLVATNDVHYCTEDDPRAHEVLLCIQTGTTMDDPKRMRIGDSFYLRTEEEMRGLFHEMPEAIDNTAGIAERCNVDFVFNDYKLPRFEVPAGETAETYLSKLCEKGLKERYGTITIEARTRLEYELSIIGQMGFNDYFLIVWDLCRFAAKRGIWWNVRGSGAGSIVAYTLRITNIDPLHHNLIFERFLNPSRISMPDIDLDFPDDQRDLLIQYTFQKYGHDKVAQIITFGTMGARAAIRDAGRALGMELFDVDRIAKMIPAVPGKACGIADAMRPPTSEKPSEFFTAELVETYENDEEARNLLDTAQTLEGVARHASTHAAGVVISDIPLVEYIPLNRPTRGRDDGEVWPVTQFNMNDVDQLGLLKVDFLGLATLTVLRRAAELVERYHGKKYTLDSIPLDDPAIYELLSSGNVTGVFQVEGAGMRKMLREMRPKQFENVVAAIALYRPGPMEYIPTYIQRLHGKEKVKYRHPTLEPILSETYGIIVYQEQIIRIARDLAGYDAGEADTIRKAVSKKILKKLQEHHKKFIAGAKAKGIPESAANGVWEDIETFARYGFNKAHAADYGVIVCQTAYLKAHYPVEYMAALLSVERGDTDKVAFVTADCRRMGIALLQPNINHSELDFTIEDLDAEQRDSGEFRRKRGIRFGLAAIKNVGEGPVNAILDARAEGGPFEDLDELCLRVDLRQVGKRALECLIKAGALDDFGSRAQLLKVLDRMTNYSSSHHQAADVGQMSLFGDALPVAETSMLYPLPGVEGDPKKELTWEKELVGLFLSDHPLQRVAEAAADQATSFIGEIDASMASQPVTIVGMVASVRQITTKKGAPMAFVRMEDLQGGIEIIVFPRTFEETRELWKNDAILQLSGKVELRDDRVQIIADIVRDFDPDELDDEAAAVDEPLVFGGSQPRERDETTRAGSENGHSTNSNGARAGQNGNGSASPSTGRAAAPSNATQTGFRSGGESMNGKSSIPRADEAPAVDKGPRDSSSVNAEPASGQAPGVDPIASEAVQNGANRNTSGRNGSSQRGEGQNASDQDGSSSAGADLEGVPQHEPRREARGDESGSDTQAGADARTKPAADAPAIAVAAASNIASETLAAPPESSKASEAAEVPSDDAPIPPDHAPYRLSIRVPRSQDPEADIALLGQVYHALTGYEGRDSFSLYISNGKGLVELDFPNSSTRYCVGLMQSIESLVGSESIEVAAPLIVEPEKPWERKQ